MNGPDEPLPDDGADDETIARVATMRAQKREARSLYWRGWKVAEIARELGLVYTTVDSWRKRSGWDNVSAVMIVEDRLEVRIANLIDKDPFTEGDMKRVDFFMRQMEKAARIKKYGGAGGNETDLNPNVANRNSPEVKAKKAAGKNLLTHEDITKCRTLFEGELFGHQRKWWDASGEVVRFILKSRQIGATWYFAREAFMRAMETGNNQIFLSASRNQSNVFRDYIREFVFLATGKELTGNPITINRASEDGERLEPVTFYFLSTNFRTAQSYHGDVYLDEVFWVPGFTNFESAASAMASQSRYRLTYFSTPSTVNHQAYGKWSGADYNRGRAKAKQFRFDISHRALKDGKRGPDDVWRQIVTLEDAIEQGFNLIDREAMERRYSVEQYRNKFLCEFLDDAMSAFPWALVGPCMVDSFYRWKDFSPALVNIPGAQPFGAKQVWIGVDPNNQGSDEAAIAVIAPPEQPGGKFRLLQKLRFTGEDFAGQDRKIREIAARYTVTDISVDISGGMGKAVHELVKKWFPGVRGITYSVSSKAALVLKGQNVMRTHRFEFDAGANDVQAAFMAIHPALTQSGGQVTYKTSRAEGIGHGDIAWAILHALSNEPMDASSPASSGGFVMFGD